MKAFFNAVMSNAPTVLAVVAADQLVGRVVLNSPSAVGYVVDMVAGKAKSNG